MKTLRIILIALCLLAAGCAPRHEGPEIVVTAGTDEEDALLAELTLALLRENGYPVGEHLGLGSARAVRAAVTGGRADLYWAYTADTWRESLSHHEPLADAGVLFRRVAEEDAEAGIVWLGPAAVPARPALVVTPGLAEEAGLAKTSDLVRYQAAVNPYLRVCAPEGMQGLAAGVRGLERVYGLRFERRVVTLPVEEGYRALEAGECDCAVGHTSDQAVRLGRLRGIHLHDLAGNELSALGARAQLEAGAADAIRAYVHRHYGSDLSLERVAASVHLSPAYVSFLFKRETGVSLIKYIAGHRVERACALLRDTNLKITDIAARVGYDDPYYFSRLFKRVIGVPPSAYRGSPGRHAPDGSNRSPKLKR